VSEERECRALVENRRRPPFADASVEAFVETLSKRLEGRVEAAYLFGSVAEGVWTRDSDVDLIVAQRTETPFAMRGQDFLDLYELAPRLDLLVYTPEEFEAIRRSEKVGFWKTAFEQMRRVV